MAKAMGQYEKVLAVLLEQNGGDVSLQTFKEQCEIAGVNMYRISTYMWEIKVKTPYGVIPIKDGRKVTGYKLVGNGIGKTDAPKPAVSNGLQAPVDPTYKVQLDSA
jgi:hypothetical protein|tara:strand:+ start:6566 stop:6883 length:318 start_codon:yes stop_codon:yes gene_type:complete